MPALQEVTRLSLKNILFPTDFSPASNAALPFALLFARIYDSTLLVAHAIPPEPHLSVPLDRIPEEDDLPWQDARRKLAEFTQNPSIGATRCNTLLDRGDVADVIPEMIRERAVDLVVLGTHGRRGVSKLVLGSSAETIYRSATCPVLTVGPKVHENAGEWRLRRILCPVDIAEDPEPALRYAISLAEENQAEIILMHSVPMVPWQQRASVEEGTRRRLEDLIPPHAKDWCTPEFVVCWEHPAEAILHTAAEREAELIVMGVHNARSAGLSSHRPWPVASEVVSQASCPVLTVRI